MNRSEKIRQVLSTNKAYTAQEIAQKIGASAAEVKFISSFLSTHKGLAFHERKCTVTKRMAKSYTIISEEAPIPQKEAPKTESPKAAKVDAPTKAVPTIQNPAALLKADPTGMIKSHLSDNASHTHRFEILSQSSDRVYIVAKSRAKGDWQCSCPGWIHHRHCKHLDALVPFLREADKEAKKITE